MGLAQGASASRTIGCAFACASNHSSIGIAILSGAAKHWQRKVHIERAERNRWTPKNGVTCASAERAPLQAANGVITRLGKVPR